jgi:hypothetical protein
VALTAGLILISVLLLRHSGAYAGGADSAGYLGHARVLARGQALGQPRELPGIPALQAPPYLYVPFGFKVLGESRELVPIYSSGLPLLVAGTAFFTGWERVGDWVIGGHSVLGLLLIYALGRRLGLEWAWALAGTVLVGLSPLYLFFSVQMMSDVPALVWCGLALWAVLQGRGCASDRGTRGALWLAVGGFAFALAVLIRPANGILLPALALALLLPGVGSGGTKSTPFDPTRVGETGARVALWGRVGSFVLGGVPGLLWLLYSNHREYGAYLTTGYGDFSGNFSWDNVLACVPHYLAWLPRLFSPVIFLVLGLVYYPRTRRAEAWVLLVWVLSFLGFYASYGYTHETWWYLRFVLPAVPALVLGGLLVMQHTWEELGRRWGIAALLGLLLVIQLGSAWKLGRELNVLEAGEGERVYLDVCQWAQQHLPKDAIVAAEQASGAVYYYTDYTMLRWTNLDADTLRRVQAVSERTGRPLYAVLFPVDLDPKCSTQPAGKWEKVGEVRQVTVWRFVGF